VLEIDGSQKSGSGTLLRLSIALAGILGEPLHIYNIRKKRSQPGLRPQHLESVLTAAKICNANVKGAEIGSSELWFEPGEIEGGEIVAEIGTAGSIPMLIMTILPLCAYAKHEVKLKICRGGTDVRNSPTVNYLKYVLLPTLERMGLNSSLTVKRYGYYPKGMGEVSLEVQPCDKLAAPGLGKFGRLSEIKGISVCTFLADRRVAERQAEAAAKYLTAYGHKPQFQIINDFSNPVQKGSSIVLWADTDSGALLGGDAIGEIGKQSEAVGREAAENLIEEVTSQSTADIHLADMLVPYVALAEGSSTYLVRSMTDHLETNIWLVKEVLGVEIHVSKIGKCYQITKEQM